MDGLENNIKMVQLRLTALGYVANRRLYGNSMASLQCFDDLIELCNLSQLFVKLLDELHLKLGDCSAANLSIDYQIASQQLAFFTSEWYDNLTPKLNETLDRAGRQDVGQFRFSQVAAERGRRKSDEQERDDADIKLSHALMRLRQSMKENERLISIISNNINYTKTTIENIYHSLRSTNLGLRRSEKQSLKAIQILRESNRCRLLVYLLIGLFLLLVLVYLVYKLI